MREYNILDKILIILQDNTNILTKKYNIVKKETLLSKKLLKKSISMMRVNHSGEICAQALYQGQSIFSNNKDFYIMKKFWQDEQKHIFLCKNRLNELNGSISKLSFLFYILSFLLALPIPFFKKKYFFSFIQETEHQVSQHLMNYIKKMYYDKNSVLILKEILKDEQEHKEKASYLGRNIQLSKRIKYIMRFLSRIMIKVTYII